MWKCLVSFISKMMIFDGRTFLLPGNCRRCRLSSKPAEKSLWWSVAVDFRPGKMFIQSYFTSVRQKIEVELFEWAVKNCAKKKMLKIYLQIRKDPNSIKHSIWNVFLIILIWNKVKQVGNLLYVFEICYGCFGLKYACNTKKHWHS